MSETGIIPKKAWWTTCKCGAHRRFQVHYGMRPFTRFGYAVVDSDTDDVVLETDNRALAFENAATRNAKHESQLPEFEDYPESDETPVLALRVRTYNEGIHYYHVPRLAVGASVVTNDQCQQCGSPGSFEIQVSDLGAFEGICNECGQTYEILRIPAREVIFR